MPFVSARLATALRSRRSILSRVRWPLLGAVVAVLAVFAMHGLGPHHVTAMAPTPSTDPVAMLPMASSMSEHHQDAPLSPSGHDAPTSQTVVALCAVIVLVVTSQLSRRFTIHAFTGAAAIKPQEVRATPEPPVPRFLLAPS